MVFFWALGNSVLLHGHYNHIRHESNWSAMVCEREWEGVGEVEGGREDGRRVGGVSEAYGENERKCLS